MMAAVCGLAVATSSTQRTANARTGLIQSCKPSGYGYMRGRTDAGVHALSRSRILKRKPSVTFMPGAGGNSNLPDDVRITWVKKAEGDFHARYSAIARFYRYIILNRPVKSALLRRQVTWCYNLLDAGKMHEAAQHLIGHHDFSSFRAQGCQSKSPMRAMYFIDVYRENDKVIIDISANAFLHHMVRNIAGVLMDIGAGKQPTDWTQHLLDVKSRKLGGITAPPDGLYLGAVYYLNIMALQNIQCSINCPSMPSGLIR